MCIRFGWVEFDKLESAEKAVQEMHQALWEGRRMVVTFKRAQNESRTANKPSNSIFIGNIPFEMSDKDFHDLFQNLKNITGARVAIDRRTGQPRGFAHADFTDIQSATEALEHLRQQVRYGRRLKLDYSTKRRPDYVNGESVRKPPVPRQQSSSAEAQDSSGAVSNVEHTS
jgi:RNA recognition motif-containing protein